MTLMGLRRGIGNRRRIRLDSPRVATRFHGSQLMKKVKRFRLHAKSARLERHLEISFDLTKPRRIRTRSARYAAALGEQLGLIERPHACVWCRRRQRLQRHHWDYDDPLRVTFLCEDCHAIADTMVSQATSA